MPTTEKIASIDIGSNTVLLLIAEIDITNHRIKTLANFYEMPRISKDLKKTGIISSQRKEKLFKVLENYKKKISEYKCDTILVSATNAFRIAENANEIVMEIKNKFGFNVKILSGDEEAKYSFLGATFDFQLERNTLVIDIGGGSTEIIYGSKSDILFKKSFGFGVVSLTENFISNYPVNNSEIAKIKTYTTHNFDELSDIIPRAPFSIAVAGTPTTLSCIKQNLKIYSEEKIEKSVLSTKDLENLISKLKTMTPTEIKNSFGAVVAGREDVLLTGTLILFSLAKVLSIEQFYVSGKGIRYGAIIDYMYKQTNT